MTQGISYLNPSQPRADVAPGAELTWGFDWSAWLADLGSSAVIESVSAVDATGGATVVDFSHSDTVVSVKLRAPETVGVECVATVGILATGGNKDSRSLWLNVVRR